MALPTIEDIRRLHKKYAPTEDVYRENWQHSVIVKEIALWCIEQSPSLRINVDLVSAGCLLHDIGVYRLFADGQLDKARYVSHGAIGYEILKDEGFAESLCRFAAYHTGVGISAEEVRDGRLPLPIGDYLAETEEEKIVMYADKFHSKFPSRFQTGEWYCAYLTNKFGKAKAERFMMMRARYGDPPIEDMAARYKQPVRLVY